MRVQAATPPAQALETVLGAAGERLPGSAATVFRRIIPALPATSAAGTVEVAVVTAAAVVAAIETESSGISARQRDLAQRRLFRFIPVFPRHQFGIA